MNVNASVTQSNGKSDIRAGITKRAIQLVIQILILGAILFIWVTSHR